MLKERRDLRQDFKKFDLRLTQIESKIAGLKRTATQMQKKIQEVKQEN